MQLVVDGLIFLGKGFVSILTDFVREFCFLGKVYFYIYKVCFFLRIFFNLIPSTFMIFVGFLVGNLV